MFAGDGQYRFHGNHSIEATEIGGLFELDHLLNVQRKTPLGNEHFDNLVYRNPTERVKTILWKIKAKSLRRE
jgi:hypothetical protein